MNSIMSKTALAALAVTALAVQSVSTAPPVALCAVTGTPGRLVAWGSPTNQLVGHLPLPDEFLTLSAGGSQQTLAIRADGTLYVNAAVNAAGQPDGIPAIPENLATLEFCGVGGGRNHGIGIRPDGTIMAWPNDATIGAPTGTGFLAATGAAAYYSIAIDRDRHLVLWGGAGLGLDYPKVVGVGPPVGIQFAAIAARGRYTLALGVDGNVYGWGAGAATPGAASPDYGAFTSSAAPWTADGAGHFIAPRDAGHPYIAIAAGLDAAVALRDDGQVVIWDQDPAKPIPAAPAGVRFTQIATGNGFVAGIDETGQLHAWGKSGLDWVTNVPPGLYSAVSAATNHIAAIEVPDTLSTVAPANIWLGLKNSDDVGTKFDVLVEVLKDSTIVGSGQLDGVAGGSSGFNNAVLRTIDLALTQPVVMASGTTLGLRVSVRIAQDVSGHRSGTARLWFNDAAANSRFGATIDGAPSAYYLTGGTSPSSLTLADGAAGPGPKRFLDVFVDRAVGGNPFKPFGTFNLVRP